MAQRHPFDPPHGWKTAEIAGKLVAQGIVEAADFRDKIVQHALDEGFPSLGDPDGFALRVLWHINDVAAFWRRERDKAEWGIRKAIAPLIAAWADPEDILAAAHRCNADASEPLLRSEVKGIVAAELDAVVRLHTRRRRRVR